jgi:hypothetical protein
MHNPLSDKLLRSHEADDRTFLKIPRWAAVVLRTVRCAVGADRRHSKAIGEIGQQISGIQVVTKSQSMQ